MAPRKIWFILLGIILVIIITTGRLYQRRHSGESGQSSSSNALIEDPVSSKTLIASGDRLRGNDDSTRRLKSQMNSLLNSESQSARILTLPPVAQKPAVPLAEPIPSANDPAAEGRRKRKVLPMGIILWDNVKVFK